MIENVHWCSPNSEYGKINFDGSFIQDRKSGAWGFVVRDHEGSMIAQEIWIMFMMLYVQKRMHA